jgi:hypothetical protein
MISKKSVLFLFTILTFSSYAQKDSISLAVNKKESNDVLDAPKMNVGVVFSNLLDLYEGTTSQLNGFNDIDLYGSNGDYTNFDMSYGLLLEIPITQKSGLDIELNTGKMTSQKETQYLKTELSMLNIHYCRYFTKSKNYTNYDARFYLQIGLGATRFNAERYFVVDNGLFSKTEGVCLNNSASLGCMFKINPKIQISLATGAMFNYTDGFDGYDNQTIGDLMLKSGLGVHFNL